MARKFTLTIRSGGAGEGATLDHVIDRLNGVLRIHQDARSSILRPGVRRARISQEIRDVTALNVLGADKTRSLSVDMMIPDVADYGGDYSISVRKIEPTFVQTLAAAVAADEAKIEALYPERSDLFRVLTHIEEFASVDRGPPAVIEGIIDDEELVFRPRVAEWARASMPSAEPEPLVISGIVKAGKLGEAATFSVFDGVRTVRVEPTEETLREMTSLFGQVVRLSGTALYYPDLRIKKIIDVTDVDRYIVNFDSIDLPDKELTLSRPLEMSVDTDERGRQFIVNNRALGIFGFGRTLSEAMDDAKEEFWDLWLSIGACPEEELHESAIPLRNKLRELVEKRVSAD